MKLKDLKNGEFFTFKPVNGGEAKASQVYIKEEYDRNERKYWAQKWDDTSDGRYVSGDKEIYTDFIF